MKEAIQTQFKLSIPNLRSDYHKGQFGKLGVLGGSFEYTGAPYYAAMSALKTGADLSYIFCSQSAAIPIKSYSPEIITLPILYNMKEIRDAYHLPFDAEIEEKLNHIREKVIQDLKTWIKPLDVLVVGPGLGRDEFIIELAHKAIEIAITAEKPIVIDGDGLWAILKNIDLIRNYKMAVLTPNIAEYRRLVKKVLNYDVDNDGIPTDSNNLKKISSQLNEINQTNGKSGSTSTSTSSSGSGNPMKISHFLLKALSKSLGKVNILKKGNPDIITDGNIIVECQRQGGIRRCGGQGDILSGILGTFLAWNYSPISTYDIVEEMKKKQEFPILYSKNVLAAWGAAAITRESSRRAFDDLERSVTANDILRYIGPSFSDICEHHNYEFAARLIRKSHNFFDTQ